MNTAIAIAQSNSLLGTSVRNGTIKVMDATHLVVVRTHKGKTEQLDFILNSETLRKGVISVGSQVAVHYRKVNNKYIATSIQTRKSL